MTRMTKQEFGDHLLFMPTMDGKGPMEWVNVIHSATRLEPEPRGFLYMGPVAQWLPVEGPLLGDLMAKWKAGDFEYACDVCPEDTPRAFKYAMYRGGLFVVRGVKKRGGE